MRRRPIRSNVTRSLDPEDQGPQRYDKHYKKNASVGEKMKWILIFLICVFGCIFCVVHLGGRAKQHLYSASGRIEAARIQGRYQMEDGENTEKPVDDRGWTDKPSENSEDGEYMEMQGGGYGQNDEEQEVVSGKAYYQAYQVDDENLVEDIEDDLPPLIEGEEAVAEQFLVEDDSDTEEIEGDINELTEDDLAQLEMFDDLTIDEEGELPPEIIDQEDELPPEVAEDIEELLEDDGFVEDPESYTVDEEPAGAAEDSLPEGDAQSETVADNTADSDLSSLDAEKSETVPHHEIETFEEALHLAEEENPDDETTKKPLKARRKGKRTPKRSVRNKDKDRKQKPRPGAPARKKKRQDASKGQVNQEDLPDPVKDEYYINLDEMDIEFNDQDQERIVRVQS